MLVGNGPDRDCNIIPRESAPTSAGSFFTRLFTEPLQEGMQMSVAVRTCAPSGPELAWSSIDWDHCRHQVRRLQARIVKATQEACADKIRETIRANKTATQQALIRLLNPVIYGWALFHRHVVAKDSFRTMDYHVWSALWRWCKRRHPSKSLRWIRRKYFRTAGARTWVFAAPTAERNANGTPKVVTLCSASDVRIQRHLKVKADANPFDLAWRHYFAMRHVAKRRVSLRVVPRSA